MCIGMFYPSRLAQLYVPTHYWDQMRISFISIVMMLVFLEHYKFVTCRPLKRYLSRAYHPPVSEYWRGRVDPPFVHRFFISAVVAEEKP